MRRKNPLLMQEILQYVNQTYLQTGRSPSTAEIGRAVGLDKSNVYRYLLSMEEAGLLHYDGAQISTPVTRKHRPGEVLAAKVGAVRCGSPEYEEEHIEAYYNLPREIFGQGQFYLLSAKGDSMTGAGISEGDLVVIRKSPTAAPGDLIVALLNGENTLKRLLFTKEGLPLLHPENPSYPDLPVTPDDEFYIQGIATHVIKALSSSADKLQ